MWRHRLAVPLLLAGRARSLFAPRPKRPAFRILLLHGVAEPELPALARLIAHVKRRHGVLTPDEAAAWLSGAATPRRRALASRLPCLFTFDDGFRTNARVARDFLSPDNIKAVFFVCPGLMALSGRNQLAAVAANVFDGKRPADTLGDEHRLLNWDELAELAREGHAIGAHGMTHRRLIRLSGDDLAREIAESGTTVASRLGAEPAWFAYAFGDIDSVSRSALEQIAPRFRFCRSGVRGINDATTSRLAVRADAIDLASPFAYQRFVLEGGLDSRYARARARLDSLVP